jgi:hypothetical protein
MTATYTGDPSFPLDRMRMTVGDTTVGVDEEGNEQALRSDEVYLRLLAELVDWRLAAAEVAEQLAAEYAQQPTSFTRQGTMSVSWAERVRTWLATASRLRSAVAAEDTSRVSSVAAWRDDGCDDSEYRRETPFTRWYGD